MDDVESSEEEEEEDEKVEHLCSSPEGLFYNKSTDILTLHSARKHFLYGAHIAKEL